MFARCLIAALGLVVAVALPHPRPAGAEATATATATATAFAAPAGLRLQRLAAVHLGGSAIQIPIELDGRPVTLRLRPHDLRAAGFAPLRIRPDGTREILPAPAPATYRGELTEDPGSAVAASIRDGRVRAAIRTADGAVWWVEPATGPTTDAALLHSVQRNDALAPPPGTCGSSPDHYMPLAPGGTSIPQPHRPLAAGCSYETQIAVEVDYPMFQSRGGTVQASLDDVEALLNATEVIYAHDLLITYALTTVVIQVSAAEDRYLGSNQNTLLGLFQNYWQANLAGTPRDVVHLLTGRAQGGNIVGVAYIGVVCFLDYAYGWSQSNFSFGYRVGVAAHEIGHNWGALHCDGEADCTIMCSGIGGCNGDLTRFSEQSRDQMANYRDQSGCLAPGNGATTPTAPTVLADVVGTLINTSATLDVLANDFDGNCDALAISVFDGASVAGGSVVRSVGTGPGGRDQLTYTPPTGFAGNDTFAYTVTDPTARTASAMVAVTVTGLRAPDNPAGSSPGLKTRYYSVPVAALPDFGTLVPYRQEILATPNFGPNPGPVLGSGRSDEVGVVFEGYFTANSPGLHTFYVSSDDGSALWVGNTRVVDNDGTHGFRERKGFVGLAAGTHAIRLEYFESGFDAGLLWSFEGGGSPKQTVPASRLTHVSGFVAIANPPLAGPGTCQAAAWGDADGDGDEDLYVVSDGANRLWRNDGAGGFTNITAPPLDDAGDGRSAAWADFDNDGDLDLYLANADGPNRLFRNDLALGFTDVAAGTVAFAGETRDAAWADFDGDGDLDLFLANGGATPGNFLLRNDGASFANVTPAVMTGSAQRWAAAWGDADGDGDPDLYVVNDGANRFFRNQGGGTFVDATSGPLGDAGNGRAAAWGDYDNDKDLDLALANTTGTRLFRNDGATFTDVTVAAGAALAGEFRGVAWVDVDADGDLDLYCTEGAAGPPNVLLANSGGVFANATTGPLGNTGQGLAAAWTDFDRDGDLDVYLVLGDGPNVLLANDVVNGNGWIEVALEGVQSNRSAIGARVRVTTGAVTRIREIGAGSGAAGKPSLIAHFGLGAAATADSIQVAWPSGAVQTLEDVASGQRISIVEMADAGQPVPQTIVIDGSNDFNPGNLFDDDRGDAFTGNECPDDPALESPLDLGRVYVTNDGEYLYFGIEYDRDCFCEIDLGIAIDVNSAAGGTSDPFSRQIAWGNLQKKPDFYLYDVVPTPCNPYNYEVIYQWNGTAWQTVQFGPNGLGIADGTFTEGRIPLALLSVAPMDTIRLEFFVTQEGSTKGPLDAVCSDAVQLSTPAGTIYNVVAPVAMSCTRPFMILPSLVGVEGERPASTFSLAPARPNPFRRVAALEYRLRSAGPVRARVLDVTGREVARLADGVRPPGPGTLTWDGLDRGGRRTAAGIYFVTLEAGGEKLIRRIVRLE